MKETSLRLTLLWIGMGLSILLGMWSCRDGAESEPAELKVPRGSTLAAKIWTAISTGTHQTGDTFTATLDEPLRRDDVIFVPLEANLEGVVVESNPGGRGPGRAYISVQLTKLYLPGGGSVALSTSPITRDARASAEQEAIGITTGLEETIRALTGEAANAGSGSDARTGSGTEAPSGPPAVIPAQSQLVFTLESEFTVPKPQ